jgi:acyl carrier protein phosphodiesterase
MNFLAHAYLSFNDPDVLAGNMTSDFIKGKKQYDYPPAIQKGIRLHREIDAFTDSHAATKEINKFFSPAYRLYAAAFTDIVYDYFLANDTKEFQSPSELEQFTIQTYIHLEQNMELFPLLFRHMFPIMRQQNWLYNYRNESGIMKSFNGMAHRATYITETATAYSIFVNNIDNIRPYYDEFFPLLKKHAADVMQNY